MKGLNVSASTLKASPYYSMAIKLCVAGVILFSVLGFYFFYVSPTLDTQELQIDEMEDAKVQLHQLEGEILALENEVGRLKGRQSVDETRLFKGSELIQMNRSLNQFAAESNIRIMAMQIGQKEKIEKSDENFDDGADMMGDDGADMMDDDGSDMMGDDGSDMMIGDGSAEIEEAEYFTIPVDFKVKGGYLDYLTFRAQLSTWGKAVNIKSETITAGEGRFRGIVTVAGILRVVQKMKVKGKF